jgi:hypothetical protein
MDDPQVLNWRWAPSERSPTAGSNTVGRCTCYTYQACCTAMRRWARGCTRLRVLLARLEGGLSRTAVGASRGYTRVSPDRVPPPYDTHNQGRWI